MTLYFQDYPPTTEAQNELFAAKSSVVIIPGLFGSTNNWRSFAKRLAESGRRVIVIDQRNHGESPHYSTNTYFDLVSDLEALLTDLNIRKAVLIGHSMGGKTAMVTALLYPELVEDIVVLDIAPVKYKHSHAPILKALQQVDLGQVGSRAEVESKLVDGIPDKGVRMFLMLNLKGRPGEFKWRINIPVLLEYMNDIIGFPSFDGKSLWIDSEPSVRTPVQTYTRNILFLRGQNSNYIEESHLAEIDRYFPNASMKIIPNAGHWLHIDQAGLVHDAIVNYLD